jgi:CopG family nickel-responsive transcriptional regulator
MLKRFSISLEEDLLDKFDGYIAQRSYENRSEAIRDLIRNSFIHQDWEEDNEVIGVISLVYDHHKHQIQEKITDLQHDFYAQIIATTHVHVDHDNCLEVIIIRGKAKNVNNLADALRALRGVKHGNLSMSSTGNALG